MTSFLRRLARGLDTALDRAVAPGYTSIGPVVRRRLPTWPADLDPDALAGQHAAVTGATSGLGLATATGLARFGATVHLIVRDVTKGARVRGQLLERAPHANIVIDRCDLADLDDVRRFAAEFAEPCLDVLIHNAGAMPSVRTESPQGHELSMAIHVLSPVLMTELLRPRLRERQARVILVTSGGMYGQTLRADDPEFLVGDYSGTAAYARSKRAQVELLPILHPRWLSDRIRVNATHPGWVDTPGLMNSLPVFGSVARPLLRDAESGADTTLWLAGVRPPPAAGELWHDRRTRPTHLLPKTRTGEPERRKLWAWVCEKLAISPD
ncbi:MAG: SDR family NAD(P)-dependent oxidoreductase [Nocardioides sp.]